MRTQLYPTIVAVLALLALAAGGEQLEKAAKRYRQDQDELKRYSWKSRVRVSIDGELKATELYDMSYGADGRVQRKLVSNAPSGKAAKELSKLEETRTLIRQLMYGYTNMSADNFEKVFRNPLVLQGKGDDKGLTRIQSRDVVHIGDVLNVWIDQAQRLHKFEIKTSFQKQPVEVVAAFESLRLGPTHVATSTVQTMLKKKRLLMETENFDYAKRGG